MKVLVLGAAGMLGHKMLQRLSLRFETVGTVRGEANPYRHFPALASATLLGGVSADDLPSVAGALERVKPQAVINCIGIVKQLKESKDPIASIQINSLFPHQLARLCDEYGARTVQFSTDCVFSGKNGPYQEIDQPDPLDLYGRSKLLGEIQGPGRLTLRTSIVGRELRGGKSLIEWFLSKKGGRAKGYAKALYTGLTTLAMADLVGDLLENQPGLHGMWHVSSQPISKYDLLEMVNRIFDLGIELEKDELFFCDRRLDSALFRQTTSFTPKPWEDMISQMYADPTAYGVTT